MKLFLSITTAVLMFSYFLYAAKWWMILLAPIGAIVLIGIEFADLFKQGSIPLFTILFITTALLTSELVFKNKFINSARWVIGGLVVGAVLFGFGILISTHVEPIASNFEKFEFEKLDRWAQEHKSVEDVNTVVLPTCGKIVSVLSTISENVDFLSTDRDEWDFRVDVCVQMTVNRVYPQPFFQKPENIEKMCHPDSHRFFTTMCRRSGL